ncbi:MAG: tRNA (adenosine(37)-N6)-threonylcarbamoyltransferase complex dimerization subunit type 1 TsaB [Candidatus Omnitrophica bacterium]|nr:tRNA (adenosine(37)-N6)-threonylcarbamoyltransferase complex dimerization subunit type 1 TsaB [Candidatus Omnitrophota bacterium]
MKLLGIETSSPTFSVAVCDGEKVLSFLQEEGVGRPSSLLTPMVEEALRAAGLELGALDGFSVSVGPGSFTGLRVGVMTVKTFSWALKKPALPVSTLEVIAENFPASEKQLRLFMDARKGKVYTAAFSSNGSGPWKREREDQLLLPEKALEGVEPGTLLAGDGLKRFPELAVSLAGKARRAEEGTWTPRADRLCAIAGRRWPQGVLDDPHRLVPQYLYSQESDVTGW